MVVVVTNYFNKDISKLRDKKLISNLKSVLQKIETAKTFSEITNLKKMEGTNNYFRIRIGDYRLGIFTDRNTIYIVRFLHRKEIYRYFP